MFVFPESVRARVKSGTTAGNGDSEGGSGVFLLHTGDGVL